MPSQADIAQKIRLVRRAAQRRDVTDFEKPFFEEDEGQHESSYFEVVKLQKSMYEKQTQELGKMRVSSNKAGASLFARMLQREMALSWVKNEAKKDMATEQPVSDVQVKASLERGSKEPTVGTLGGSVLAELEKEGRQKVKLKLAAPPVQSKKRKKPFLDLE